MRAARMFRHLAASIGRRELAATCRECPMFRRAPLYRVRADTYSPGETRESPAAVEQRRGAWPQDADCAGVVSRRGPHKGGGRAARLGASREACGGVCPGKVLPEQARRAPYLAISWKYTLRLFININPERIPHALH